MIPRTRPKRRYSVVARLAPAVCGTAGAALITKGVDYSSDGKGHELVTYLGFYGAGAALLTIALITWLLGRSKDEDRETREEPAATVSESPGGAAAVAQHTGAGSISGNVLNYSPITVAAQRSPRERTFNQAIGDAETELRALSARMQDALDEGWFPLGFFLPAEFQQAAADALEDRGLRDLRREVDDAYNACDRLNHRLEGRFWDEGPMPDPAPARVQDADRLQQTIEMVQHAAESLAAAAPGREIGIARPHIVFGAPRVVRRWVSGAESFAEFVVLSVTNQPPPRVPATAFHPRVTIEAVDGTPLLRDMPAKWADREPRDDILPPNGQPFDLDTVMGFVGEGPCWIWNEHSERTVPIFGTKQLADEFRISASEFYVRLTARFSEGDPEETRFSVRREFLGLTVG